MNSPRRFGVVVAVMCLGLLACAGLTPTSAPLPSAATPTELRQAATVPPNSEPSAQPTTAPSAEPAATATPAFTATPRPTAEPTAAPLTLELLQSQTWTDALGHTRVNVLLHNPHAFAVEARQGAGASLYSAGGTLLREREFYFFDGISGGGGYVLPGETVPANACFTCEAEPLAEAWATIEFNLNAAEADNGWEVSTEVAASVSGVEFDGDSPIFWFDGEVTNNSGAALQRISVRLVVLDEAGQLVGVAEASAWDVAAGATGTVSGYGFGQTPAGPVTYEVTAAGVNY